MQRFFWYTMEYFTSRLYFLKGTCAYQKNTSDMQVEYSMVYQEKAFLFYVIENRVANTINATYARRSMRRLGVVSSIIIRLLYTVRIPIFWLADLYRLILGCDETTSLTSLSWCNSRGVNSTQHCHYTMASADSKFDDFFVQCIQFE